MGAYNCTDRLYALGPGGFAPIWLFPGNEWAGKSAKVASNLRIAEQSMRQQSFRLGAVYEEENANERLPGSQYLAQLRYSYEVLFTPGPL